MSTKKPASPADKRSQAAIDLFEKATRALGKRDYDKAGPIRCAQRQFPDERDVLERARSTAPLRAGPGQGPPSTRPSTRSAPGVSSQQGDVEDPEAAPQAPEMQPRRARSLLPGRDLARAATPPPRCARCAGRWTRSPQPPPGRSAPTSTSCAAEEFVAISIRNRPERRASVDKGEPARRPSADPGRRKGHPHEQRPGQGAPPVPGRAHARARGARGHGRRRRHGHGGGRPPGGRGGGGLRGARARLHPPGAAARDRACRPGRARALAAPADRTCGVNGDLPRAAEPLRARGRPPPQGAGRPHVDLDDTGRTGACCGSRGRSARHRGGQGRDPTRPGARDNAAYTRSTVPRSWRSWGS